MTGINSVDDWSSDVGMLYRGQCVLLIEADSTDAGRGDSISGAGTKNDHLPRISSGNSL